MNKIHNRKKINRGASDKLCDEKKLCGEKKEIVEKDSAHNCCNDVVIDKHIVKNSGDCHMCGNNNTDSHDKIYIKKLNRKKLIYLIISLIALTLSYVLEILIDKGIINNIVLTNIIKIFNLSYIAIILCGFPIFKKAIIKLKEMKVTASLLISVAISASICLEILALFNIGEGGHYAFAAGEIAFLMALGELIEEYTVGVSRRGIEKILKLMPDSARVKKNDEWVDINIKDIVIGDIALIKPSEQITVDGVIVNGSSAVDQSTITGEAMPYDKKIGDKVYTGTWNKQGALEVMVDVEHKDTTMSKLIDMINKADAEKTPIARLADKYVGYIVPLAVTISIAVFFIALYAFNTSIIQAIIRAVTILVVFCPCALALATPTAIAAGIGNAANKGIMVKSGEGIEKLNKIDTIAMDKTGTVTEGRIAVYDVIMLEHIEDKQAIFNLVYSAENMSDHPIATAITQYFKNNNARLVDIYNMEQLDGIGIKAEYSSSENSGASISNPSVLENSDYEVYKGYSRSANDKNSSSSSIDKENSSNINNNNTSSANSSASVDIQEGHPNILSSINKENLSNTNVFKENSSSVNNNNTSIESLGIKASNASIDKENSSSVIELVNYNYALKGYKLDKNIIEFAEKSMDNAHMLVIIIINNTWAGAISLTDKLRKGAEVSLSLLNRRYNTLMLTGDNKKSAHRVAEQLGFKEFRYELLPQDKVESIKQLKVEGRKVCFIGDGINDSPSLKVADCSIAMGELGVDLVIENADITILNSDIRKVPYIMDFSRRVIKTIKINIWLSMLINFLAVILSTYGILTPVTGAVVHNLSSVLVVLNSSMLLLYGRKRNF